jgi:hypothetical protein
LLDNNYDNIYKNNNYHNTYNYYDNYNNNNNSKFDSEYEIIKTLDAGAFGIVYKCKHLQENIIYAVKKTKKTSR